jgi:predicted AlkP superfamily phosphohydrolase/phosphomutase
MEMSSGPHDHRVVVIGWDGATFDLLGPWLKQGKLPNLAAFISNGAHGPLGSTTPPFTYPAWTTFLTGKNPGRHGVFDFTERIPGTHRIQFVNARSVRSHTLWRLLSDAGQRVACMGVPVTYPPEPVNGVLICGFDSPQPGNRPDESTVYPPGLLAEIRRNVGQYVTSADIMPLINQQRYEEALDLLISTLEMKGRTALYLLERERWDVFMVLFGECDRVGHNFWRFTDPNSPLYAKPTSPRVADAIYHVYAKLDEILGLLLKATPDDCVRLLVSDHGFGGAGDRVIYMNNWLAEEGFLTFCGRGGARPGLSYRLANRAKEWGLRFLPATVRTHIFRRRPQFADRLESYLRFSGIDWSRTQAFSEELPYLQSIWINVKGREPAGIVEPGREYEEVVERLSERLLAWHDPENGKPVVQEVLHCREIYDGPYVDRSPDLLVRVRMRGGYSYQGRSSRQAPDGSSVVRFPLDSPEAADYYAGRSGSHRDHGVLAMQGPMVSAGRKISGARLMDIAPTILYLLGEPVPGDMDGVVLTSALNKELLASRPVLRGAGDTQRASPGLPGYAAEEEHIISQRLRDLGYLE